MVELRIVHDATGIQAVCHDELMAAPTGAADARTLLSTLVPTSLRRTVLGCVGRLIAPRRKPCGLPRHGRRAAELHGEHLVLLSEGLKRWGSGEGVTTENEGGSPICGLHVLGTE
jgi:hypothetical protein